MARRAVGGYRLDGACDTLGVAVSRSFVRKDHPNGVWGRGEWRKEVRRGGFGWGVERTVLVLGRMVVEGRMDWSGTRCR